MGKLTPEAADRAVQIASGVLAGAGNGEWVRVIGRTNIAITGAFTGSIRLVRSFDGGATAAPCTAGGQEVAFAAPATEVIDEREDGVLYRFEAVALSAGAANWRISR